MSYVFGLAGIVLLYFVIFWLIGYFNPQDTHTGMR